MMFMGCIAGSFVALSAPPMQPVIDWRQDVRWSLDPNAHATPAPRPISTRAVQLVELMDGSVSRVLWPSRRGHDADFRDPSNMHDLADSAEFAWSLLAECPETISEIMRLVSASSSVLESHGFSTDGFDDYHRRERALLVHRIIYDASSFMRMNNRVGQHPSSMSRWGSAILWSNIEGKGSSRLIWRVVKTDGDLLIWDDDPWVDGVRIMGVFATPTKYDSFAEHRELVERASLRYDLPLRVARLRECADWLDEHGPSVWIAPD